MKIKENAWLSLYLFVGLLPFASAQAETASGASAHNLVRNALNNAARATVGSFTFDYSQQPKPSPALADMTDDTTIANTAATHAAKCLWQHSSFSDRNGNGENLFASTSTTTTVNDAVASWASEVVDYSYANNSCATGAVCGHYTQIVWDDSTKVGCAIQQCSSISNSAGGTIFSGRPGNIIVCQYNQPGNFLGQHPYEVGSDTNTLNELGNGITTTGISTKNRFTGGARLDLVHDFQNTFSASDQIDVIGSIHSSSSVDLGQIVAFYAVAELNGQWFMQNSQGQWLAWQLGDMSNLVSIGSQPLGAQNTIDIADNISGLSGNFKVFFGYLSPTRGEIVYNRTPISFTVN